MQCSLAQQHLSLRQFFPVLPTPLHCVFSLRFGSPPQRDPNWSNERPNKPPRHQGAESTSAAPRTFTSRSSAGTGRMPPPRNYPRVGGYKESRPSYRASEAGQQLSRGSEQAKQDSSYRAKRPEHSPPRDKSPELEAAHGHGSPSREELALDSQATAADAAQPPPDRPVEKKSYSRARRTRVKAGEAGKLADEVPTSEGLAPVPPKPVQAETSTPPAKSSNWESAVEPSLDGLEQEMTQMNLAEQNWSPGQSQFLQPRELRGKWAQQLSSPWQPPDTCSALSVCLDRAELPQASLRVGVVVVVSAAGKAHWRQAQNRREKEK